MEGIILSGNGAFPLTAKVNSRLETGLWAIRIESLVVENISANPGQASEGVFCLTCNLLEGFRDCAFTLGELTLFPLPQKEKKSSVSTSGLWHDITRPQKTLSFQIINAESRQPMETADYTFHILAFVKRVR